MIVLPIWLWLLLFIVVAIVFFIFKIGDWFGGFRSVLAVAQGVPTPDSKMESLCRAAILKHEGDSRDAKPVVVMQPLECVYGGKRFRSPISLGLTECTLGVSVRQPADKPSANGSTGQQVAIVIDQSLTSTGRLQETITTLINRRDIKAGYSNSEEGRFSFSIEAARRRYTFRFQSQDDLDALAAWVPARATGKTHEQWRSA